MIQVLIRAMGILELLGSDPQKEFSISEISKKMSLDKGTCTNIMKTLVSRGFVQQDAPRGGYRLGYALFHMTSGAVVNDFLTKIAREEIDELGTALNETVLLSVIRNDKRIVLYNTIPDRSLMVRTNMDKNIYTANTGRVILANYTPDHLEKFLIRRGLPSRDEWPEVYQGNDPDKELRNILSQIKQQSFAVQVDGNDIIGFAVPIFREGHVAGSVGAYMPLSRAKYQDVILSSVIKTAENINLKISKYTSSFSGM